MSMTIQPYTFLSINTFKVFPRTSGNTISEKNVHPIFLQIQLQNQLSDKLFSFPPIFFSEMDFCLLTMVTIFRPEEMLAMI